MNIPAATDAPISQDVTLTRVDTTLSALVEMEKANDMYVIDVIFKIPEHLLLCVNIGFETYFDIISMICYVFINLCHLSVFILCVSTFFIQLNVYITFFSMNRRNNQVPEASHQRQRDLSIKPKKTPVFPHVPVIMH